MTIINSFVQGDRAYLLTDTAWLENGTGRILLDASKLICGHNFPWTIAVTGDAHVAELANQLNHFAPESAKEIVEALPLILSGLKTLSFDPTFHMAVRLAAWCEHTERARVFHIDTDAHRASLFGIEPWEVVEADVLIPDSPEGGLFAGWDLSPERIMDPARFDPVIDGAEIIELQRRGTRGAVKHGKEPVFIIGGCAQLACVTREGVAVETVRTWPEDCVGELIRPAGSNVAA